MKKIFFFLAILCFAIVSCTKDKTDYEAETGVEVPDQAEFKEVVAINSNGYTIQVEAVNGALYKGYNEIRFRFTDSRTKEKVEVTAATFLPVMTDEAGTKTSCPHRSDLAFRSDDNYFAGYSVFTAESTAKGSWQLEISFTVGNQTYTEKSDIVVQEQTNKNLNMTVFTGNDDEHYIIALVAPQHPKVAENELIAGIYKLNTQFSYSEVMGYTLQVDPRMPEPSMGNHSSPNNKDLTRQDDGLYHGVVNYTMTGNWTLNFILLNEKGKIIKGTEVSKDFTPGVEGAKSELYIDVLF